MSMIRLISDDEVRRLIPLPTAVDLVEQAFRADALGGSQAFAVVRTAVDGHDGIFGIKSGRLFEPDSLGLKAGGYWRANPERHGISAHQSTIVLFEPATGRPEALLRANYITEARTGAAGAVAANALANPDAGVVAVVGAGRQARAQVEALSVRFALREVRLAARRVDAAQALADAWQDAPYRVVVAEDAAEACRGADIVVTTTPSFDPLVSDDWISPGTHVNAIGSDTRGKGELDARLFERCRFFVDSEDQSRTLGEGQRLGERASVAGTLGGVLAGNEAGRVTSDDVTVFDSTGVTFQDLVMARYALDRAREQGVGLEVEL
jgi:ornithine cyclodeaminase/alanine dehydrogenase-like protein (mu-crystallin family)